MRGDFARSEYLSGGELYIKMHALDEVDLDWTYLPQ